MDHLLAAAFDASVMFRANEAELKRMEERDGRKKPDDVRKRSRAMMWVKAADTAPEGSELQRQARAIADKLLSEVGG